MRVSHDHSSVETVSARVYSDRLDRRRLSVPADPPTGEVVQLVVEGTRRYARFRPDDDGVSLRGVYDTPEYARDPEKATDRLGEWLTATELEAGRTVHVDIVEDGYRYGLRAPGDTATYRTGRPPESLAEIAADLE